LQRSELVDLEVGTQQQTQLAWRRPLADLSPAPRLYGLISPQHPSILVRDDQHAARPSQAGELGHERGLVRDVGENLERYDQVEALERQVERHDVTRDVPDVPPALPRPGDRGIGEVGTGDGAIAREQLAPPTRSTPDVDDVQRPL